MSEVHAPVKQARIDPQVIAAWNEVCARDATLRRRLRHASTGGTFLGFGLIAISSAVRPNPSIAFFLVAGGLLALVIAVLALIWNNILVARPACPACGEPVRMTASGHGWTASHPESQEWCPHCFVWLKHPSDPHRPQA